MSENFIFFFASSVIAANLLLWWKLSFGENVFTVYMVCSLLLVTVGVITWPFYNDSISAHFSSFDFSMLDVSDYARACLVSVLGLTLINGVYSTLLLMSRKGGGVTPIDCLSGYWRIMPERGRLSFLVLIILLIAPLMIHYSFQGLRVVAGVFDDLVQARRELTDNYVLVLIIYNTVPQVVWALLLIRGLKRGRRSLLGKGFAFLLFLLGAITLLSTVQKRPFMVYLLVAAFTLVVTRLVRAGDKSDVGERLIYLDGKAIRRRIRRAVPAIGLIAFASLVVLYAFHTNILDQNLPFSEKAMDLVNAAWTRIFGRLSIPSFFYVHYFPAVEQFYGWNNVGLLAALFDREIFLDTRVLFEYYTGNNRGAVAVSAIFDFYGQAGIVGVTAGSIFLGMALFFVDAVLSRQPRDAARLFLFLIFSVWAFYLTQASFFRATMGYGLIPGLLLYVVLFCRVGSSYRVR